MTLSVRTLAREVESIQSVTELGLHFVVAIFNLSVL